MKFGITFSIILMPTLCVCQLDSTKTYMTTNTSTAIDTKPAPTKKAEIFNSGFIDFQNSSQIGASARIFKIYLGEPDKFVIPLSFYSGVSGNSLNTNTAANRNSEQIVLSLLNPMSGVFNVSSDNLICLNKNDNDITRFSMSFKLGEKVISGYQQPAFKSFNFFCTYVDTGLLFETGAWEKNKENNMGVFWIWIQFHGIRTSNSYLALSGYPPDKKAFKGYSVGCGIEINKVLNIKTHYYRYIKPGDKTFEIPIYQLTFNYSMKN